MNQNKKDIKPLGFVYRVLNIHGSAMCFMCSKDLYSSQGFQDHIRYCTNEDGLYSIAPRELLRDWTPNEGSDGSSKNVKRKFWRYVFKNLLLLHFLARRD